MADTFGFKIGITGESEFKRKLSEINQDMKVLGSELKAVSAQFDGQDKSVQSLTAKNQVLHKSVDEQKFKVQALTEALDNASTSFGENDKRTKEWRIKLNNATAELYKMENELKASEAELAELEKAEKAAAEAADKLSDEVKGAGDEAKKSGKKFINMKDDAEELNKAVDTASKGIYTAAAAIGAAIAAAATAMAKMTVDAAAYADQMITTSTVTGVCIENLQAYSYAADLVDVSLDILTKSMARNISAMSKARDGSASYADAYKRLGIEITNTDGSLRNSEDVYWEVIDALGKMKNETEQDALAMTLFGKSAQDLNPLIQQGSEGIAALTKEAKNMGAVLSDETIHKLGEFDDSVQRLKQGFEAAKRNLGTVLLPELQRIAKIAIEKISAFTKSLQDPQSETRKLINDLKSCANVIGNILATALKVAANILLFLAKNIKVVVPVVGSLATAILVLKAALSITATIEKVKNALAALPDTATAAKTAMTGLSTAMSTNVIGAVAAAAAAIAMLTIAIVGLVTADDDEVEATPAFVKAAGDRASAAKKEKEEVDKAAQSYWDMKSAQDNQAAASIAQLDHTKTLTDELLTLADSSGKVKEAEKERAQFILDQLNSALGTEYEMTGNQIKNYEDLRKSIYDTIEAKKAQILLEAYEPVYVEALQKRIEKEKEQAKLTREIAEQEQKAQEAQEKMLAAKNSGKNYYNLALALNAEETALKDLIDSYKNNEAVLVDYYTTIADYELASTEVLKGNTDIAIDLLDKKTAAYVEVTDIANKSSEEQKRILTEQYETLVQRAVEMEQRYRDGVKGVTQEMVDDAKTMAAQARSEIEDIGKNITKGMAVGVESASGELARAMTRTVSQAIRAAKVEAQIASPSKRTKKEIGLQLGLGAAIGVTDSTPKFKAAVVEQMKAIHSAYKQHSNFGIDLAGTMGNLSLSMRNTIAMPSVSQGRNSIINVYPQQLTNAQVDYLVQQVNQKLGFGF